MRCLLCVVVLCACTTSYADGQREKSKAPTRKQLLMTKAEAYLADKWTQQLIAKVRRSDFVVRRQNGLPPRPPVTADPDIHGTLRISLDPPQPRIGERYQIGCSATGQVGDSASDSFVFCCICWQVDEDKWNIAPNCHITEVLPAGEVPEFGMRGINPGESKAGPYSQFYVLLAVPLGGGEPVILDAEQATVTLK